MKKLWAVLIAVAALPLLGQDDPKFNRRSFDVQRVAAPLKIDGVIDPAEWAGAKPMELAWETFPQNNVPASVKSEAFIGYDENNLYVALRAFDPNPGAIRAHLTDRDSAYSDDFIGIAIDTFNDERRAFEFFVNPLGVQMDLTNNDLSGNEDDSWDAIWHSAAKIHGDRYEVEMAIPFTQLRFKDVNGPQTWGIDVVRIYPRDQRIRFGLHPQNKNRSCYVCQFSKLSGFEGITPGRNLEFQPTVTAHRTDARPAVASNMQSGDFETEPGLTTRWGVTPNLTLLGTLNPDFSQIEADSGQLDINTTFALFYNEKRPFFLEGADFFEAPLQIVYTRTVAAPDWGAKLTGKEGKNGGGLFVAQDAVTNLLIPGSQGSSLTSIDDANLAAVARYRYDIGANSNVGVLATTRQAGDYSNLVGGVDGVFRFTKKDTIQAQLLTSMTEYPDAVAARYNQPTGSLNDTAGYFRYRHNSREWFWQVRHEEIGTEFRADSGFMPRVDYRMSLGGLEHVWWPKDGQKTWYNRIFWGGDYDRTQELSSGTVLEEELETWFGFGGPMQSYVSIDVGTRNRHYGGHDFNGETFLNIYGELTPRKQLFVGLDINAGDQIDFTNIRPATRLRLGPNVRYRVNRNLDLQLRHTAEWLDVDEGRLFNAQLSELRAVYQFNVRTFVRAIVQYTDIKRNPDLYLNGTEARTQELFPQFLFSYKLNPQTVLFVGYSSSQFGDENVNLVEFDRTLFVKVGYSWAL